MKTSENFILTIALITMLVSAVSLGFTYYSVNNFKDNLFSGYATFETNATINITVASNVVINFTTNNINFGTGSVNAGTIQAYLDSGNGLATNSSGWSSAKQALVLENIGTANVSISIRTYKNATTFIGGTNPSYAFNITNNNPGSCTNITGFNLNQYYEVNATTLSAGGSPLCTNLPANDATDSINISIRLIVPYDSLNGTLGDFMTAIATG